MRILATITVRNESAYIAKCLAYHIGQGIEMIVIDNGSTDDTVKKCEAFLGKGLRKIIDLPYKGHFDLTEILEKEAEIQQESGADWLIHLDADEILQCRRRNEKLADAIARVDRKGFNAIHFDEFVFLPEDEKVNYWGKDYLKEMCYYYYFHKMHHNRLIAFKKEFIGVNIASGGHRLEGKKVKVFPKSFYLRHYIGLSADHLHQKYAARTFAPSDLAKGWHTNRKHLDKVSFDLPPLEKLETYPASFLRPFRRKRPYSSHFWEWE